LQHVRDFAGCLKLGFCRDVLTQKFKTSGLDEITMPALLGYTRGADVDREDAVRNTKRRW